MFPGPSGGRTALVNIDVPPHSVGLNERAIALQVVATLTSSAYGAPLFRAVKIEINGRLWPPQHPGQALGQSFYQRYIPHAPAGTKAYYLSQDGGLRTLAAGSVRGTAVLRASGTGQVALSRIAISPKGNELAGLGGPANTLYTGSLATSSGRQAADAWATPRSAHRDLVHLAELGQSRRSLGYRPDQAQAGRLGAPRRAGPGRAGAASARG